VNSTPVAAYAAPAFLIGVPVLAFWLIILPSALRLPALLIQPFRFPR
jgi:hypothetical protein